MTESEWLASTDPQAMLEFLGGKASERKLRLFACACVRKVMHLLTGRGAAKPVEFSERYADGLATTKELHDSAWGRGGQGASVVHWRAWDAATLSVAFAAGTFARARTADHQEVNDIWDRVFREAWSRGNSPWESARAADAAVPGSWLQMRDVGRSEAQTYQCRLLRDIVGNPFYSSPYLPTSVLAWNDRTVPRLAQAIYDDRRLPEGNLDPSRLAIIADALLDAGCDDEELLTHLRSPGPHVRGCFAIDIILGRS